MASSRVQSLSIKDEHFAVLSIGISDCLARSVRNQ